MPTTRRARTRAAREEQVRAFVRANVRAGLLDPARLRDEVRRAIAEELSWLPTDETAERWIADETAARIDAQGEWPAITDYDRLQDAFAALEAHQPPVAVLQACEDHWAARDLLASRQDLAGVAWFVPSDVWHAIDEGMLEINVWHADGANVAPGDLLLDRVIDTLAAHGLRGHFDEGRIEVSAHWHRRYAGK